MRKNKTRLSITKSKLTELLGYEPFGIEAGKTYRLSTILNLFLHSERKKGIMLDKHDHKARIIMHVHSSLDLTDDWTVYWVQDVNRHGEVVGIGFFSIYRYQKPKSFL